MPRPSAPLFIWYSVVRIDDDTFAFVVGDVSGHGIPAAGMMASLRFTTRAYASLGFAPNDVIDRVNTQVDIVADEAFATVLVGVVSISAGEMTVASAGHPAPYVRRDDRVGFVELTAGPPLGVGHDPVKATTVPFPPGSTLVAFTDGLVERRDADLEARLEALVEAASYRAGSAEQLVTHILAALVPHDHEDDIALIVVKHLRSGR